MGYQTFTCVICGESCTRRTSKRYKEGRACNKHQEVQDDQQAKQDALLKSAILDVFYSYKKTVGIKHPNKAKLKEWLEAYVQALRTSALELVSADKTLSLYKTTGMITLKYEVSDKFVDILCDIIKARQEDTDWVDVAALKREYKAKQRELDKGNHPKSEKDKRTVTAQGGEEDTHRYKLKERRGAKEAPRRKATPKR